MVNIIIICSVSVVCEENLVLQRTQSCGGIHNTRRVTACLPLPKSAASPLEWGILMLNQNVCCLQHHPHILHRTHKYINTESHTHSWTLENQHSPSVHPTPLPASRILSPAPRVSSSVPGPAWCLPAEAHTHTLISRHPALAAHAHPRISNARHTVWDLLGPTLFILHCHTNLIMVSVSIQVDNEEIYSVHKTFPCTQHSFHQRYKTLTNTGIDLRCF